MKSPRYSGILAFLLVFSLFLCIDDADARRIGGGRSFGSSSSMRKAAPAPAKPSPSQMQQQQTPAGQQAVGAGAAAAAPSRMGGFGGLMGGLLAGSLLGAMFMGTPFAGGGFMDIILIGLLIFFVLKFLGRRKLQQSTGERQAPSQAPSQPQATAQNRGAWDTLRTAQQPQATATSAAPTAQRIPENFDSKEFLDGAKAAYARLNAAWDARDLSDISNFVTPSVLDELQQQVTDDPNPAKTDLLLVNAQMMEVSREADVERASVFFDVLLRENPSQDTPVQAREIWHFVRPLNTAGMWKLDGIQQVE